MEEGLTQALWALEGGYCLWVGAGLTRQVAAGHAAVPLWDQITLALESAAGIQSGDGRDFPTRLDRCLTLLGEKAFRDFLRERYYTRLCQAVLSQANLFLDTKDGVPDNVRAVAALGQLANPIVSFNIEPLSSLLLGRSAGPIRIVLQQPQGKPRFTRHEGSGRFQRLVYHPHGLATVDTVMTATQYQANSQTLAFGLAIHASFANTLAIVGMSLDDEYLRRQIERFRPSIGSIYWFNSQFSDKLSSWATKHDITTVCSEWSDFWQHWRELPIGLEPRDLAVAWWLAVNQAVEEAEGGSLGSLERSLANSKSAEMSGGLRKLAADLAQAGILAGEPGKTQLIGGKTPREIEWALRTRLIDAGVPLPIESATYDPGTSPTGTV
ncbi:MAG: hypothetical protein K0S58_3333 [Nitrospira sp.]|nr:hypothetical protein [Nitrospira sp.]